MPVRESQARLLADTRTAEPRARLAQAAARADYLMRLTRSLSTMQRPDRAIEDVVRLLLEDVADVVAVTVRYGTWEFDCCTNRDDEPACRARQRTIPIDSFSLRHASGTEVETGDVASLESWLADEAAARTAINRGVTSVLTLPLSARGRDFGVLVLGRYDARAYPGAIPFLTEVAERITLGLDTLLVLAESRHIARVLRASVELAPLPEVPGLDLSSRFRVAHESELVGGDFIDGHGSPDDFTLLIGDVAGKGVFASVGAKRITYAVRTLCEINRDPAWVLEHVNRVVEHEFDGEWLATAICARLRPRGDGAWDLDLAQAGHPAGLVVRVDGRVESVNRPGVALAVDPTSTYEDSHVRLDPGDLVVLFTDGVTEAHGAGGRLFGEERLVPLLSDFAGAPASAVSEAVHVAVSEHLRGREHDDIAVLVFGVAAGEPS